jgi:hypothetical protein
VAAVGWDDGVVAVMVREVGMSVVEGVGKGVVLGVEAGAVVGMSGSQTRDSVGSVWELFAEPSG